MKIFFSMAVAVMLTSINAKSQVKDVDGNTYKTILINSQAWMAENLSTKTFRNGDLIPQAKSDKEWEMAGRTGSPAWCYYNFDAANGEKYGKLYNWYAVNDSRGLAPKGWLVPTKDDLDQLIDNLGGSKVAGQKLKSSSGWTTTEYASLKEYANGSDETGFSALPGGQARPGGEGFGLGSGFIFIGEHGEWWSSGAAENNKEYVLTQFSTGNQSISKSGNNDFSLRLVNSSYEAKIEGNHKNRAFSVRCLKNEQLSFEKTVVYIKEILVKKRFYIQEILIRDISVSENGEVLITTAEKNFEINLLDSKKKGIVKETILSTLNKDEDEVLVLPGKKNVLGSSRASYKDFSRLVAAFRYLRFLCGE